MAHMSAQISQSTLSEKERVTRAIERIEALRDKQTDPLCRWYYQQCLVGWRQHLARLGV